jgi:hypothetical protein
MTIGYGVGAVAVGVGAYLWWRSSPRSAPIVRAKGDAVAVGWAF